MSLNAPFENNGTALDQDVVDQLTAALNDGGNTALAHADGGTDFDPLPVVDGFTPQAVIIAGDGMYTRSSWCQKRVGPNLNTCLILTEDVIAYCCVCQYILYRNV